MTDGDERLVMMGHRDGSLPLLSYRDSWHWLELIEVT